MTHTPAASSQPLPEALTRLRVPLAGAGVALLVVSALIGMISRDVGYFLHAYLTAYIYCLTISVGALFVVALQHLARAGWSVTTRRIMELLMANLLPMAILFLPILVSVFIPSGPLYDWSSTEYLHEMHVPEVKTEYLLNSFGFTVTTLLCFAGLCSTAWFFWSNSRRQDETHDRNLTAKMQRWSGPALIVISLTTSAAAFIWVMSLRPTWFSTMFGVYLFAGSMLAMFATLDVLVYIIQRLGGLKEVTIEHWHDLGKFTFGFTFFWAYIAFSQYMLIWYANIPEETVWFWTRQTEGWAGVSLSLVFLHWAIPFVGTMSRHVRRRPYLMCFWGVWILVMHYVDIFWLIMPEAGHVLNDAQVSPAAGGMGLLTCLLCVAGMVSLYFGLVFWRGADAPAIPVGDPRLPESLVFENVG